MSKLLDNLNSVYRGVSLLEGIDQEMLRLFSESIDEVNSLERSNEYNQKQLLEFRQKLHGPESKKKGTGTAGGGT